MARKTGWFTGHSQISSAANHRSANACKANCKYQILYMPFALTKLTAISIAFNHAIKKEQKQKQKSKFQNWGAVLTESKFITKRKKGHRQNFETHTVWRILSHFQDNTTSPPLLHHAIYYPEFQNGGLNGSKPYLMLENKETNRLSYLPSAIIRYLLFNSYVAFSAADCDLNITKAWPVHTEEKWINTSTWAGFLD